MKLIKFTGKGIRGYMNHEINFRESVTFLVGINGSGKTSVLKLINGLTSPSFKLLDSIEYSYIELYFTHDTIDYIISSTKDKDSLIISINHIGKNIVTSTMKRYNDDYPNYMDEEIDEIYSEKFDDLEACSIIRKLTTPLFIGIDRMPENDILTMVQKSRRIRRFDNVSTSPVDSSLKSIQEYIYDLYRRNAAKQKKLSDDFRTAIVRESLKLMTSETDFSGKVDLMEKLIKNEDRRSKLKDALLHAGIDDAEVITDIFFDTQRKYLNILKHDSKSDALSTAQAFVGLSFSNAQMEGIDNIISHEAKYKESLDKLNEQFNRFIECANLFFKESGKEIKVQDNGLIKVYNSYITDDGRLRYHASDINSLSSGEKQIVALIGSLIFTASNVRPEVMIIDEPELSLHLTWQDIFVDAILKAQPNFQFVLATHSPTIISKIERRNWCEDLSKRI